MAEVVVNDSNFEAEVLNSSIPVLVDFWAEWCGPCRMLGPVISSIAEKYDGKIKVCKVNVDDAMEVAEKYFISSIPAVKIFKGGEVVEESIGFVPQPKLEQLIDGIL
ncbi:MAG: thioredoxin [Saccharofermentans sp.]|nr:thioredoxin [Saccharofermentans sp.]